MTMGRKPVSLFKRKSHQSTSDRTTGTRYHWWPTLEVNRSFELTVSAVSCVVSPGAKLEIFYMDEQSKRVMVFHANAVNVSDNLSFLPSSTKQKADFVSYVARMKHLAMQYVGEVDDPYLEEDELFDDAYFEAMELQKVLP